MPYKYYIKQNKFTLKELARFIFLEVYFEENRSDACYKEGVTNHLGREYIALRKVFNPVKVPELLFTAIYELGLWILEFTPEQLKDYSQTRAIAAAIALEVFDVVFGFLLYVVKHLTSPINTFIRPLLREFIEHQGLHQKFLILSAVMTLAFIIASVATGGFTILGLPFIAGISSASAATVSTVAGWFALGLVSDFLSIGLAILVVSQVAILVREAFFVKMVQELPILIERAMEVASSLWTNIVNFFKNDGDLTPHIIKGAVDDEVVQPIKILPQNTSQIHTLNQQGKLMSVLLGNSDPKFKVQTPADQDWWYAFDGFLGGGLGYNGVHEEKPKVSSESGYESKDSDGYQSASFV